MEWWVADLTLGEIMRKIRTRVLPNVRYLPRSRLKICGACRKATLIMALGDDEEFHLCIRCRANLRYEMLARYLRSAYSNLVTLDVLELDDRSPLRQFLGGSRSYTRSFYRRNIAPGSVREDGAVCQDITHLTYPDASLDLIVSSDVLEHVPDVVGAFRETARVLRAGGAHVFTVPPRPETRCRVRVDEGRLVHLQPPEYHRDPLSAEGILAYWDFGPDMGEKINTPDLELRVVLGPEGSSNRVVWEARRL